MDCEVEYMDPDEEFEMMHAEEMEMMDELAYGNEIGPPKKSLKFDNIPVEKTPIRDQSFYTQPSPATPNFDDLPSTSSGIYHAEDLQPLMSQASITNGISQTQKFNGSAKVLSPPLMNLEDSLKDFGNTKIVVTEKPPSNSNKRTTHDLFGDIDDIDFNDVSDFDDIGVGTLFKKQKIDNQLEDKDALLISRILEERKKRASNTTFQDETISSRQKKKSECVLVRRVPKWNFITLRNGKGEKFYTKLHSDEAVDSKIVAVSEQCKNTSLLNIPFEDIMNEANAIISKKIDAEINALPNTNSVVNVSKSIETDLWVEKYKPMSYIDLLSDEGTNRILLQWVKLWDKVVFGREKKVKIRENKPKFEPRFQKKMLPVLDEELDDTGCPKFKLVLLCGPPGLGKTTLAHVVARHAGYNPVEMNASDDRSPEVFKQQLEAATQMRAVIGTSPRPNCLIIDEIDGAPSASIDVLVKFAKGENKKTKKKGAKLTGSLKRPIICICNDVYVPALRPLRQMAFVIHFPPTSLKKLTQRLIEITHREKIKTDLSAIMALCEKASNDIRTCLSTIYCLKDGAIKTSTISQANVGSKDMQKGLFTVWRDIFQIQTNINTKCEDSKKDSRRMEADLILLRRLHSVLSSVQGNGDYDRLAQGVYENFLNVKSRNFSMNNISKSLKWFCFFDQIKTTIASTQTYTLMTYMPFCFVMWHFLYANYLSPKLNYPSLSFELMTRQSKNQQIIQEILKGMEPRIRAYSHYEQLLLDNLPYLTYLLNPNIRPISIQLFSNAEKAALYQLVNTMIDYNLNFVQERTLEGSYQFVLDPNIDEAVEFPGIPKSKPLPYSLKMSISREVEQEKLKRLETSLSKNQTNSNKPQVSHMDIDEPPNENLSQEIKQTLEKKQNHLQKLTPKAIKKTTTASMTKDFFGRVVEKAVIEKGNSAKIDEIVKSDIWYHFKEGYSNAVRRSVYVKNLLKD